MFPLLMDRKSLPLAAGMLPHDFYEQQILFDNIYDCYESRYTSPNLFKGKIIIKLNVKLTEKHGAIAKHKPRMVHIRYK